MRTSGRVSVQETLLPLPGVFPRAQGCVASVGGSIRCCDWPGIPRLSRFTLRASQPDFPIPFFLPFPSLPFPSLIPYSYGLQIGCPPASTDVVPPPLVFAGDRA